MMTDRRMVLKFEHGLLHISEGWETSLMYKCARRSFCTHKACVSSALHLPSACTLYRALCVAEVRLTEQLVQRANSDATRHCCGTLVNDNVMHQPQFVPFSDKHRSDMQHITLSTVKTHCVRLVHLALFVLCIDVPLTRDVLSVERMRTACF